MFHVLRFFVSVRREHVGSLCVGTRTLAARLLPVQIDTNSVRYVAIHR